jgi:hypothetical protein
MRLVNTKHLFLTTRNRSSGDIHDAVYKIPSGALTCKEHETFRICLTRLSFYNDIYNINETNNTLRFVRTTDDLVTNVTLPFGNYPYSGASTTLGKVISSQYKITGVEKVIIKYTMATNRLTFSFTEPHELVFTSDIWRILGFNDSTTRSTTSVGTIESDVPVRGRIYDRLYVKLKGVTPTSFAFDNMFTEDIRLTNGLAAITITSPPYTFMNYVNQSAEEMAMYLANKAITKLRLEVLDGSTGAPATFLKNDMDMVLRIDTFNDKPDGTEDKLDKMIEYLRYMFMMQGITKMPDEEESPDAYNEDATG